MQLTCKLPFFCVKWWCSKWHKLWRSHNSSQTSLRSTTTNAAATTAVSIHLYWTWFYCTSSVTFMPNCFCFTACAMCFWCTTVTADCNFLWYGCRTVFIFNPFHIGHCYTVFGYCITQKQRCLLPPSLSSQSLIHILRTFNSTWHTTHS